MQKTDEKRRVKIPLKATYSIIRLIRHGTTKMKGKKEEQRRTVELLYLRRTNELDFRFDN